MGNHWRARTNVRTDLGGNEHPFARYRADNTQRDPYPLPAGSIIRGEGFSPVVDERTKGRPALSFAVVVLTLWFVIPLLIAGIMLRFH